MEAERLIKMIDGIDYSSEYSDDEDIRVNLNDLVDIRESQEFMEASKSFDHYMEGNRIMKSFLEEKKENQDLPNTTLPVS